MAGHTERLSVVVHPGREQPDKRTISLNTIHGEVVGYSIHRGMPDDASINPSRASSITFTEARRNAVLWAAASDLVSALQACIEAMDEHDQEDPFGDEEFDSVIAEAQDALRKAGV